MAEFETEFKASMPKQPISQAFDKGMVPAGYGQKNVRSGLCFTDEVLKTVENEMNNYLSNEARLDNFCATYCLLTDEGTNLDMTQSWQTVDFAFEVGLKPDFEVDATKINVTKYKVAVTDEMVQ
jgi:trigger factor